MVGMIALRSPLLIDQGLVGTMGYTHRCFLSSAQVTLGDGLVALGISLNGTKGTDHDTHPATHTAVLVAEDSAGEIIPVNGASDTCLNAVRFDTVTALHGEG
jgi:hypothetical protein